MKKLYINKLDRNTSMKLFVFLLALSCFSISKLNAQTLSLNAEAQTVCEGQNVVLNLDYGACSSVIWEYSTDFANYIPFGNKLTPELTYQVDKPICFRVKGTLDGQSVYSNSTCIDVEYQYKPTWRYNGDTIPSGYVIDICEGDGFRYSIPDAEEIEKKYKSEWQIDGVKVNNDINTKLGPFNNGCKVTHIITSNGVCPPVVYDFNYRVEPLQKITLEPSSPIVCEGSEATLNVTYEKTPAEVYWKDGYDSIVSKTKGNSLNIPVYDINLYYVQAVSPLGCISESDYVLVDVEKQYVPSWKNWPSNASINGTSIYGCVPYQEEFISLNENQYKDTHKSQWLLNGVVISNDFSIVSPPIYENSILTHIVTGDYCPPVSVSYEMNISKTPKLELSVLDKSCDGEVTLSIDQENGDYGITLHSINEGATQENPTQVLDSKESHFIWKETPDQDSKYWLSSCYEYLYPEGKTVCCSTSDTLSVKADKTEELEVTVVNWRGEEDGEFTWETYNYVNRCYPEEFKTKVKVIKGNPISYVWKRDGEIVSTSQSLIEPTRPVDTEYTVEVSDGCHNFTKKFWLTPEFVDSLKLLTSKIEVCEGDSVTIILDKESRQEMWLIEEINGSEENRNLFITDTLVFQPKQNAIYWAYDLVLKGCGRISDTVSFDVKQRDFQIEVENVPEKTLCYGDEFEVDVNVVSGNPDSYEWWRNGELLSVSKTLRDKPTESKNEYELIVSDGSCSIKKNIHVNVSELKKCELSVLKDSICQSEETDLHLNQQGADVVYLYEQNESDINPNLIGDKLFQTEHIKPKGNAKYWAVAYNNECSIVTDTVSIYVEPSVEFSVSEFPNDICIGEEINATVSIIKGTVDQIQWLRIEDPNDFVPLISETQDMKDVPVSDMTYNVLLKNKICDVVGEMFYVKVHNPNVDVEDVTICEETSIVLTAKADQVYWYDDEKRTNLLHEGPSFSVSPTETVTYHIVAKDWICEKDNQVTVNVNPRPVIIDHVELDNGRSYLFNVEGGTGKLLFDYGNGGEPTESNMLKGTYNKPVYHITVTDELGCSSTYDVDGKIVDLNIPIYFYANRETWKIEGTEMFNHVSLKIFDRYGRLLVTTNAPQEGWNGTYNGCKMPSADYWYLLDIEDMDIQRSGHFTLLRE